jgi:chromosome segregation ATPase
MLLDVEQVQRQQRAVYDEVVQERDILGTQLIRRNDELALLYEKIRIQQAALSNGEHQYRDRVRDINALKLKLAEAMRELQLRSTDISNVEVLKQEIHRTQRELLQERTKVKALSEELENPMNVHRWRKLEGSDPKRYELIQKIQMLQKRLISKTEEVVEKDLLLQEKERLYLELKSILARQPGPEVAEQLSVYQQSIKEKTRQLKAMAAEVNMLQTQVAEYHFEVERLNRELQDTKRKYYDQRKRDGSSGSEAQRAEREAHEPAAVHQLLFLSKQPRIVGGGFNLTAVGHGAQSPKEVSPALPTAAAAGASSIAATALSSAPQRALQTLNTLGANSPSKTTGDASFAELATSAPVRVSPDHLAGPTEAAASDSQEGPAAKPSPVGEVGSN